MLSIKKLPETDLPENRNEAEIAGDSMELGQA